MKSFAMDPLRRCFSPRNRRAVKDTAHNLKHENQEVDNEAVLIAHFDKPTRTPAPGPATASRRLCILIDGTATFSGITNLGASQGGIKSVPALTGSNMIALANLLDNVEDQLVYYHSGVATSFGGSAESEARNFLEALFGNIDNSILDAYSWLAVNYREGDSVFGFGFSRGAATLRSLFNFIRHSGLIRNSDDLKSKALCKSICDAYGFYKEKRDASEFKKESCVPHVDLQFLGLFDCVPALDVPKHILPGCLADVTSEMLHCARLIEQNNFHDMRIGDSLPYAFHALSMDETSKLLPVSLFERVESHHFIERKQHWFRGFHGDIGGMHFKRGLADVTLEWMIRNARRTGLVVAEARQFDGVLEPLLKIGLEERYLRQRHALVLNPTPTPRLVEGGRDVPGLMRSEAVFASSIDESVDGLALVS
ncbi:hypothetical protein HDU98_011623 [Podochytrium sp. JEL0797]|nr:hypothetical protein HDU98_011623 [Podochytrium sp. JEL0797]